MKKTTVAFIAVVAFALGAGVGVGGWIFITAGSGEASVSAQDAAPTLSLDLNQAPIQSEGLVLARVADRGFAQVEPASTEEPEDEAEATPIPLGDPIEFERGLYRIATEGSEARFFIDETLMGDPVTVVGVTSEVGGDVIVDFTDPSASTIGTILINARTIITDNDFRNRALRSEILRSADDAYEFIEFVPTAIQNVDFGENEEGEIRENQVITFDIVGDMTVIETTNEVIFNTTVTVGEDGNTIVGFASALIWWEDFNITIPDVPGVADISVEVPLELEFTADLVETADADMSDDMGDDMALGDPIEFPRALYRITAEDSEARFFIDETLRGEPVTVIGTTTEVGGDVIVDFTDPSASTVGTIVINARTIVTDNDFRNRALRSEILRSAEDAYEFIEFVPTAIQNIDLGDSEDGIIRENQVITFDIVGDMTVIETTTEVIFNATVTVGEDGNTITGLATSLIWWEDFNITIPDVPGVADVSVEVPLELEFTAELIEAASE